MKTCLTIFLVIFVSITSFAKDVPCSTKNMSGSWKHQFPQKEFKMEKMIYIHFKKSTPVLMDLNETGSGLDFTYKSIYNTATLDTKACILTAHLDQTQSITHGHGDQKDSIDYNQADQVHYFRIRFLSSRHIELTDCQTDASCAHAEAFTYDRS